MTISNRITLDDLRTMQVGEIAALPGDHLALLKDDADEAHRTDKTLCDWLDGAIALKYGDEAQEARRAEGNDTGAIRLQDGAVTVIADMPKKVDWNQAILATLVERIRPRCGRRASSSTAWPGLARLPLRPELTIPWWS